MLIDPGLSVHPRVTRVGIRVLASDEERWFTTPDYQQDQTAVLSPDGRKIAATYTDYTEWQEEIDDGAWSTVIVDAATGTVLADTPWTAFRGWPNGTWLDAHTVVHNGWTEDGKVSWSGRCS